MNIKKFLILLTLFLTINVCALEKSIFDYSSGVDGRVVQKTIITKLDSKDEFDSLIISSKTGIYIKNDLGNRFIKTNEEPISVIAADVNGDSVKDIVYSMNTKDGQYNVVAINGKDDTVLWTSILTEKKYNNFEKSTNVNINIYKIEHVGSSIVIISDYSLYVLDIETGKLSFKYKDKDNIWDVTEVKDINNNLSDEIGLCNQLGEVKLIDSKTGKLLWNSKILEDITLTKENVKYSATRNIWQIEYYKDNLYALGEDGTLFNIDRKTGKIIKKLNILPLEKDTLEEYYFSELSMMGNKLFPTNKTSEYYKNFEMTFREDKVIVNAFLNSLNRESSYSGIPMVFTIDLNTFKTTNKVEISSLKLLNVDALEYNSNIIVPVEIKEGYIIIHSYDNKSGKKLNETKVFIGSSLNSDSKDKILLQETKDGVLLEQSNNFSVILDSKLSSVKTNNNSYSIANIIRSNNNELITSYKSNNIIYKIEKYDGLDNREPKWEYNIPNDMKNNGLFSISNEQDFNKDGINDVTALINKLDSENRVVATYFLIIDSNTGNIIKFKPILTGTYYENGKRIDVYLTGNNLKAIKDVNGDKISDFIIDSSIISGSNISMYGIIDSYINTSATKLLNVGDVNNDSIEDIVAIEPTQSILFTSRRIGQIISYTKSNKKYVYPKDVLNQDYAVLIPDLNKDGIKELVVNDRDKDNKQIFRILSGKDLTNMFVLNSISQYGSFYRFLNADINKDGIDDFYEIYNGYNYNFISGKDGSSIIKIETQVDKPGSYEPILYREDTSIGKDIYEGIMMFSFDEADMSVVLGIDINKDNNKEIFILKEEYYPQLKLVLEVYDIYNKNSKPIRTVDFYYTNDQNNIGFDYIKEPNPFDYLKQITEVVNGDGLYIIKPPTNMSIIYDAKTNKILSEINSSIIKSIKISNTKLFGVTTDNSPININYINDLTIKDINQNSKSPLKLELNKTSIDDMRVINIFYKGNLISTEYKDNFELPLKDGKYELTLKAIDRWGKTQNYDLNININKSNPYLIIMSIMGILIILLLLYISIGHKIKRNQIMRRIYG